MPQTCPNCNKLLSDVEADAQTVSVADPYSTCPHCGATLKMASADDLLTDTVIGPVQDSPKKIGHFALIRKLGEGSFGTVWHAQDTQLDRPVALKLFKYSQDMAGMLREAQTAAKLKDPGIVAVYEVGTEDGLVFIASEFIDGMDLRERLAAGRLSLEKSVSVLKVIARATHTAHQHNIIHRDLKPANIIMDKDENPFVTDFGIAKQLNADETISLDGQIIGTISYMSPEQARGVNSQTDCRSDVYSLGVILFEMLTEFRPFRGDAQGIMYQKTHEDCPSPRKLVPTLPRDLETICLKCLRREPANRYQSAAELADELERFEQEIPILARPITAAEKTWRWCRRNRIVASLIVGIAASLIIGLASTSHFWFKAEENANQTRQTLRRARMEIASSMWYGGDAVGLRQILDQYPRDQNGSPDDSNFVWDFFRTSQSPIMLSVQHGQPVEAVAVSKDGSMFVSVGVDGSMKAWNTKTSNLIRRLDTSAANPLTIAFSPVDDRLISADSDGRIRTWHPADSPTERTSLDHGPGLTQAEFSPDRKYIASAGRDGKIILWHVATRKVQADLSIAGHQVRDIRFSPDGSQIAVAVLDPKSKPAAPLVRISIWDVEKQEYIQQFPLISRVIQIDFFADGTRIAAGTENIGLRILSLEQGKEVGHMPCDGAIKDVISLPDSDLAVCSNSRHQTMVFDTQGNTIRTLHTHDLSMGTLSLSADGTVLVVGSGDGSIKMLKAADLTRATTHWIKGVARNAIFTGNGREVAIGQTDGAVRMWNPDTNQFRLLMPADSGKPVLGLSVHQPKNLLVACGMMRELRYGRPDDAESIAEFRLPFGGYSSSAVSSDGNLVALGSKQGAVLVYRLDGGKKPVAEFPATEELTEVRDLCFSKSGSILAVCYASGQILTADIAQSADPQELLTLESSPHCLTFCYQDQSLATGTQEGEIHLIRLDDPAQLQTIRAHSGRVNSVDVFPQGTQLVSGGHDGALRIWDSVSGERIASLAGHSRQIFSVNVSPDGKSIVSSGLLGDIRIWRSQP